MLHIQKFHIRTLHILRSLLLSLCLAAALPYFRVSSSYIPFNIFSPGLRSAWLAAVSGHDSGQISS